MIRRDRTFIIAEVGVNHNSDIDLAKKHIDAAVDAGVDAVKFQCYKAEDLVVDSAPQAEYQSRNTGRDETQVAMLKRYELEHDDFIAIKNYVEDKGVEFIATPYDKKSVDFLESIGVDMIKVSSGDITNYPLLRHIAQKGGSVILSTGASDLDEVIAAQDLILKHTKDLFLLHCTSCYPTEIAEVNLRAMQTMMKKCTSPIGLSDHTTSISVSIAAVALGACIIERHITLDKNLPGPDHKASLEPAELKEMVTAIREVECGMGSSDKKPCERELEIRTCGRRSLVTTTKIEKGTVILEDMLIEKRPARGISPTLLDKVVGKTCKRDLPADYVLDLNDIDGE